MKKYVITITPVLKNEPLAAVVLDVSAQGISVNYPKNAGVTVGRMDAHSGSELCLKMPDDDNEFHFWYDESCLETDQRHNGL